MKRYPGLFLISRLQADLDRLFEEARDLGAANLEGGDWLPEVDVVESAEAVRVLVEVPGVRPEDLAVEISGDRLTVAGTKSAPAAAPDRARYHRMERSRGAFSREIRLPRAINTRSGRVRLVNGVLIAEFPKLVDQRRRAHRLPIEVPDDTEGE